MRKGLGFITWLVWSVLMLTMVTQCGNPLGPTYEPRYHLFEVAVAGSALYILGAYLVARAVSQRTLVRALFGAVGLFTVTLVAWLVYHASYGAPPMVEDWDSYTRVTPFHTQLAVPVFVALVGGIAILVVALRMDPPDPFGPLTS